MEFTEWSVYNVENMHAYAFYQTDGHGPVSMGIESIYYIIIHEGPYR